MKANTHNMLQWGDQWKQTLIIRYSEVTNESKHSWYVTVRWPMKANTHDTLQWGDQWNQTLIIRYSEVTNEIKHS